MQREPMYQGKAALASALYPQPRHPTIKLRPWGRLAWLIVAVLATLVFWSTT